MSDKTFYVTTPIYYVNARPHIGHAYTTIVADVLARRHRLLGDETFFLTGTDEHGQKIERSAAVAGIPPQQFADQVSRSFEDLWKRMGITNDDYIRTTSEKHKRGVQKLFSTLYERGFIYLASYTGSYCVSDEAFVDAPVGTPCPDCGRLLEEVTEENFFFKLSEFQLPIIELIDSGKLSITPESRRNEVLSFVRGGLKDLSISRSSFTWGIPVPEPAANLAAQKHVIYVWLDALANYMTALGYGSDDEALYEKFWPADLHLVGKEIIRFHCVYWPAFLLAAGLPLPKAVTAHGWLLFDDSKMSKSKGNIVRTETILDAFGSLCPPPSPSADGGAASVPEIRLASKQDRDLFASDVLRYFLLREIPFGQDGSFSFDALITRYNADLANGYGNLVSRTLSMIGKYFEGAVPDIPWREPAIFTDNALPDVRSLKDVELTVAQFFANHAFSQALSFLQTVVSAVDQFISRSSPWKIAASSPDSAELRDILATAAESIRIITALLYPILPYATAKVWAQLGLGDIEVAARDSELNNLEWGGLKPGTQLGPLGPIFPRADKGLAQIMSDMENPTPVDHSNTDPAAVPPSTDPGAPPRTTTLDPVPVLPVGGSTALTSGPSDIVSHTQAQASGIFAQQPPAALAPENGEAATQITIDDFVKVELRVAQILIAERIPKADKLLRLEVDLGEFGKRQILSGIAEWYSPEELIGRRIVVITNLAPRKMRGLESHGMLLAASEEGGKPFLATIPEGVAVGTRLK
jgi:methionyl-tRNA synthetase